MLESLLSEFTGLETETYCPMTDKNGQEVGYGVNPQCPKCKGIGWVTYTKDNPRTGDFTWRKEYCDAPGCLAETFRWFRNGVQGFRERGARQQIQTFGTFNPNAGAKQMFGAFKELAEQRSGLRLLLVYGGTGNGKTHCCNALVKQLTARGLECKYWTVADLFSMIRAAIATNTIEDEIERYRTVPALIMDDWVGEYASKWESGKVEQLIDYRYRHALLTVLTTNRPLSEIPDRIVSRFNEKPTGRVVLNSAKDWRKEVR